MYLVFQYISIMYLYKKNVFSLVPNYGNINSYYLITMKSSFISKNTFLKLVIRTKIVICNIVIVQKSY